jgi:hypothetical protein
MTPALKTNNATKKTRFIMQIEQCFCFSWEEVRAAVGTWDVAGVLLRVSA